MAIAASESINWKEVYDHLLPRVFHFFWYKVGDKFIAEELTSVTFERAWVNRENYKKNIGEFQFWLFGIAQKVAADYFRRSRPEVPLHEMDLPTNQNMERELESQMDFERLAVLLKILPDRERLLIALKYGAELNNREIARQTGLSESNVGTILFRAVSKLREGWEQ